MNKKELDLKQAKLLEEMNEKLDAILSIVTIEPRSPQHHKIKKRSKKDKDRLKAGF